jgi:HEAT repeat protein
MTRRLSGTSPSAEEAARLGDVDALLLEGDAAVGRLVAMLSHASWSVRRAVISALAALGDTAVDALCQVLLTQRDDENRIAAAVDALSASTAPSASGRVVALATTSPPAVAAEAASILGRRRASAAIPTLIELTRHGDDNVAVAAIEALGRIGGRAAIEALVDTVRNGGFFRSFPAIDVLGRSGDPRAVEPLAELLSSQHLAAEAARALGRTGERNAVRPLSQLLSGGSDAMARVAAVALGDLEARHAQRLGDAAPITTALRALAEPPMVRRLVGALGDADEAEQVAICRLLGLLGGSEATEALARLLDSDPAVAAAAGRALAGLSDRAERELLEALVRGDSARRLVLLPMIHRAAALPMVLECLGDPDDGVRAAACEALGRIGSSTAVEALFRLFTDGNPRVVQAAVGAVQALGGPEAERLALEAARAPWPSVRRAALRVVAYFGWASGLGPVREALRDSDERVREAAVQALPFLDDARALDDLLEIAGGGNARMRAAATRALGQGRSGLRSVAALLRGLVDPDAWVRYYACQSLGRLGVETATTAIARLLADPAGQVRVAAIEALSHLPGDVAFEALRDAAAASDVDIRRAALVGLGLSRRPEAAPILIEALASSDVATRLVALAAIADFDETPEVMTALGNAVADAQETVRNSAVGFLAARNGVPATRILIDALRQSSDPERVIEALTVPAQARVATLAEALETADDELASLLVSVLARSRRPDADRALRAALSGGNPAARRAAASVIAVRGADDDVVELRRMASADPDAEVRRVAALLVSH